MRSRTVSGSELSCIVRLTNVKTNCLVHNLHANMSLKLRQDLAVCAMVVRVKLKLAFCLQF